MRVSLFILLVSIVGIIRAQIPQGVSNFKVRRSLSQKNDNEQEILARYGHPSETEETRSSMHEEAFAT